jgi:hypothetical protein
MNGIELRKKYPIKIDIASWTSSHQSDASTQPMMTTLQYLFTPDIMKEDKSQKTLIIDEDKANIFIRGEEQNSNGFCNEIKLKGTVSSATNDYILVFSKDEDRFHLHDVGLSVNGLKRDRENDFSEVRNQIETSSEIKAKMNKRLKSSIPKVPKMKSTKKLTEAQIPPQTNPLPATD